MKRNRVTRKAEMRIVEGREQVRLVTRLAERGATDLADVEAAVRRIVSDVRRNGDRAVRRYATRWDGLGKGELVRVPEADLQEAWEKNRSRIAGSDRAGCGQYPSLCGVAGGRGIQ